MLSIFCHDLLKLFSKTKKYINFLGQSDFYLNQCPGTKLCNPKCNNKLAKQHKKITKSQNKILKIIIFIENIFVFMERLDSPYLIWTSDQNNLVLGVTGSFL